MSVTIRAHEHREWVSHGLKDYGDFIQYVEYVNQSGYGDGQIEGEWWYAEEWDDETGRGVIYYGSFGNYNSPGASCYTAADVYDHEEEYRKDLARWESLPEYLEEEGSMEEDGADEGVSETYYGGDDS